MEQEIYDDIGRYVAGEMEGEELRAFEEKLKSDPELKEKTALFRSVSSSLANRFQHEEKEKELTSNLAMLAQEHIIEAKPARFKWYALAAAASVVLCAVIFYTTQTSNPEYDRYASFEPLALVERGETDSLKVQAQKKFNEKKYTEALPFINAVLQQEPKNADLKIYKAIILVELDQYREADALLDSIRTIPSVYQDKAQWIRALSALKQKEYEACRTLLMEIGPEDDHYKEAQRLLDDL